MSLNSFSHTCVEFAYALAGGIIYGLRMGTVSLWVRFSGMATGTLVGTFIGPGIAAYFNVTDVSMAAAIITATGIFGATIVESLLYVVKDKEGLRQWLRKKR